MEARLIKAEWKNGNITNERQILMILGYEQEWIIDVLAAPQTKDYLERVIQSVRIDLPYSSRYVRQSFGKTGVSFLVDDYGEKISLKTTPSPNNPVVASESMGFGTMGAVSIVVYELTSRKPTGISDELGKTMVESFAEGYSESNGVSVKAVLRDKFDTDVDGIKGRHLIFDFKTATNSKDPPVQGDLILLSDDVRTWSLLVITNYAKGSDARYDRGIILNSLRIGY